MSESGSDLLLTLGNSFTLLHSAFQTLVNIHFAFLSNIKYLLNMDGENISAKRCNMNSGHIPNLFFKESMR